MFLLLVVESLYMLGMWFMFDVCWFWNLCVFLYRVYLCVWYFCDSFNKKEKELILMNLIMIYYILDMLLYVIIEWFWEMIVVYKFVFKILCSIIYLFVMIEMI